MGTVVAWGYLTYSGHPSLRHSPTRSQSVSLRHRFWKGHGLNPATAQGGVRSVPAFGRLHEAPPVTSGVVDARRVRWVYRGYPGIPLRPPLGGPPLRGVLGGPEPGIYHSTGNGWRLVKSAECGDGSYTPLCGCGVYDPS